MTQSNDRTGIENKKTKVRKKLLSDKDMRNFNFNTTKNNNNNCKYRFTAYLLSATSPSNDDTDTGPSERDKETESLALAPGAGSEVGEWGGLGIDTFEESLMDISIQNAVKNFIEEAPKDPEISPLEVFQQMYKDIKAKKVGVNGTTALDPKSMLESLFPATDVGNDPFDERKVMIKLRNIMHEDDFKDMFKNPAVGDFL
jgi:hypothetical protein